VELNPAMKTRVGRCSGLIAGFTLPELVVTVAIVGVIAALAAPSFNNLIRSQRIKTAANDLVSALLFARSEAVKRNADVTVSRVGSSWTGGWTVSYDDGGAKTPRSQPALNQLQVTTTVTSVTFGGGGRADSMANFTVDSDPTISNVEARCVEVGLDGLPRVWVERSGNHNCADD
jgi:type IV fimbrial biogenesis protein FimT